MSSESVDDGDGDDYGIDPAVIAKAMRKLVKRTSAIAGKDLQRYCFVIATENGARLAAYLMRRNEICAGRSVLAETLPGGLGDVLGFVDSIPVIMRADCPTEMTYFIEISSLSDFGSRDDERG